MTVDTERAINIAIFIHIPSSKRKEKVYDFAKEMPNIKDFDLLKSLSRGISPGFHSLYSTASLLRFMILVY